MVNILLVLGDQQGINPKITKNDILIPKFLGARRFLINLTPLDNPTQDEFQESLRSKSFDILILVGHTKANDDGKDGSITINDGNRKDKYGKNVSNKISMNQFAGDFRDCKRLKLVILAGCCSDGAARQLTTEIGVPKVIAFRRPIASGVVKVLFGELFSSWIKNSLNLHWAIRRTRVFMQKSDPESPGASGTLILLTSSNAEQDLPLMFSEIARSSLPGRLLDPLLSFPFISTLIDRLIHLKYLVLLGIVAVVLTLVSQTHQYPTTACDIPNMKDIPYLSCGDKTLFRDEKFPVQDIVNQAKNSFDDSWKKYMNANKPELAIALSNARNKLSNPLESIRTIAVMLPLSEGILDNVEDLPKGMLGAVAQAQKQWNEKKGHWNLEVMLVNDNNNENKEAKNIAQKIADIKPKQVLGLISNYSSNVTGQTIEVYNTNKITAISSTATATNFSENPSVKNTNKTTATPGISTSISSIENYFFRITGTTNNQARNIINFIKKHEKIKKIKIISGDGIFPESFAKSLIALKDSNLTIEDKSWSAEKIKEESINNIVDEISKDKGITALVINMAPFNNGYESQAGQPYDSKGKIYSIFYKINQKCHECIVIANETIVDKTLWKFVRDKSKESRDIPSNLLFVFPYIHDKNINKEFSMESNGSENSLRSSLVTSTDSLPVFHRVYLTFDATYLLLDAIDKGVKENQSDEQIRANLPDLIRRLTTNSEYYGMTGQITFKGNKGSDRIQAENFYGLVKPTFKVAKITKAGKSTKVITFEKFVKAESPDTKEGIDFKKS